MSPHFWWYLSRAAGLTSLGLALLSVTTGLAISGRVSTKRLRLPWSNDLHRYLSVLTLSFLALHVGALAFDTYAPFSLQAMLLPGAAPWRPLAVTFGLIGFYALVVIDLTSRFRSKLKARVWRAFHLLAVVVYVTALLHAFQSGPDTALPVLRYGLIAVVLVDVTLLLRRLTRLVRRNRTPTRSSSQHSSRHSSPHQPTDRSPAPSTPPRSQG